jgi:hypothetical protein
MTPSNAGTSGAIRKGQILANAAEPLHYGYTSSLVCKLFLAIFSKPAVPDIHLLRT